MNRHLQRHNEFLAEIYPGQKPLRRIMYLDLETRSELDVKKVGAWEYAAHPSTEIMCASYAIDDGPIQRWLEDDFVDLHSTIDIESPPEGTLYCFHNAEFEAAIFEHILGWQIPVQQILDSAAVARHANLPGKLEPLGEFFGEEKDMDGNRVMLKLSKPRRPSKANPDRFWRYDTKPDDFERMYQYCDQDVHVSRLAMSKLPAMSVFEMQVYAATFDMNRRGVRIDRENAKRMQITGEAEKKRLSDGIKAKYGFTLGQVAQVADFVGLTSVAKAPLRDLLKDPSLPEDQREVAQARQTFAKTSLNKLPAFLGRSASDGRVRGNLMYGGAERTLRWSGSGVQMQNITRGIGQAQDIAFAALESGLFDWAYEDEIIDVLSNMLRGLIQEMCGLLVGDYAQIEARMLAWLAGDEDLLDQFRRGLDPYRIMAAKIYHKAVEDITSSERFMGKQCLESSCLVLTDQRGWVPIVDVTRKDLLWDGEEWVSHQGVLFSGLKPTIRKHGVGATSDHQVYLRNRDGSWKTKDWLSVQSSEPALKSAIQSATLPSSATKNTTQKEGTLGGDLSASAAAETSRYSRLTQSTEDLSERVTDAAKSRTSLQKENDTHLTLTSYSTKRTDPACLIESPILYPDATIQSLKTTATMAEEEFVGGSKIAGNFWSTSPHSMAGRTQTLSWTGSTTMEITNPGILDLSLVPRTALTKDPSSTYKNRSQNYAPVYDIANVGPRHRFTILTDRGPMIVANCILGSGYGLGYRGFMTMLDQTYDVQVEVTEAKSVTEAYRKNAPKIVALWKRLERAMLKARGLIGKIVQVNDKIGVIFPKLDEMHIILPSKRRLRYYQVKLEIKANGFTSWSCFGKLKSSPNYGRVSIYGGALTGHITQSSARDVMASAIVRLWRKGYPLILTVHDEIVSLKHGTLSAFEREMEELPWWLTDFPLKVDAFETVRYRK